MAAPSASTSNAAWSVLAITFFKCKHLEEQKLIKNVSHSKQMDDLFQEHHSRDKTVTYTVKCKTDMSKSAESFEIEGGMSVGTLSDRFQIKCLEFTCMSRMNADDEKDVQEVLKETNKKAVDAFKLLMAGGRRLFTKRKTSSSGVKDGLSRKDELFNDLVGDFEKQGLDWPSSQVSMEGAYFIQKFYNIRYNV
ncbi:uncharacterized protein LOC127844956 [Dreissena polymorpha]|uniref:uncharacterized protein LOC127844956 n=1 Tax=Dreissena polymorpha TaxID=45954 RepID=UPI002264A5E1|nr:uncharacterized protein LOC127844956 [Dreissena polymorpha]